jgi:uncharacterized membrane protein
MRVPAELSGGSFAAHHGFARFAEFGLARRSAPLFSPLEGGKLMTRKQALVLVGMVLAAVVLLALWLAAPEFSSVRPVANGAAARLAFAAQWLTVPGIALLVGIGFTANRRFFLADAIDGTQTPQSRALDIALRYNRNTLEQTVLAAIAWLGLALALPQARLALIPELAILFAAGRALFWLGYLYAPWARAFGFALTFYPTVAAYLWLALRATGR